MRAWRGLVALLAGLAACAGCAAPGTGASPFIPATVWQTLARNDLRAIRDHLVSVHPGALDAQNPGFREQVETGYRQSLERVVQVDSQEAALATVRRYVAGFSDGQLAYADPVRDEQPRMQGMNGFELRDGVLWVRVGVFHLRPGDLDGWHQLLNRLRAIDDAEFIVFDTRGHAGGDSALGRELFEAATGGLVFDTQGLERLPRTTAAWRVSGAAVAAAREVLEQRLQRFGPAHPATREQRELLQRLQAALHDGQPWVEQDAGPRLDRDETTRRGGHLRRFKGRMAVLTDGDCAGACLDFVDAVKRVPGSVHTGQTTRADSLYADTTDLPLPSGHTLAVPLKIWRNPLRGPHQAWGPDLPIDLGQLDEHSIRVRTVQALIR